MRAAVVNGFGAGFGAGFFVGDEPRFANGVLDALARAFRADEFTPAPRA